MSALGSCAACKRLVRVSETACPFCRAPMVRPRSRARTTLGRVSRSALLVSAAVALGNPVDSCKRILGFETPTAPAYGGPPIPLAVYGGPPPTVPTVLPVPPPSDGGADASDAALADAGAPARVDAGVRTIPKPAYGGPPPKH